MQDDEKCISDASVGEYFNANFVNAQIDMEKGEGPRLAKNIMSMPIQLICLSMPMVTSVTLVLAIATPQASLNWAKKPTILPGNTLP
ncbi:MAG: hypothetical protein IPI42_06700 [Saprospiraceae bacterium]|nr:hypothetical protein [Candidatus Parvibacillus calidus]